MGTSFKKRLWQYCRWRLRAKRQSNHLTSFITGVFLCVGLLVIARWDDFEDVQKCQVIEIITGQTLKARCDEDKTIRLWGINGNKDPAELKKIIKKNQSVTVAVMEEDRYHRWIAKLYINGEDVGLALVKAGSASVNPHYNQGKDYIKSEKQAKMLRLGIWH